MEFNMRRNFIWTSAIVLSLVLSSFSFGQEVLLDFRNMPGTTGSALNGVDVADVNNAGPFGFNVSVPEAMSLGLDPMFPFQIQVREISSTSDNPSLRSNSDEFGIQSNSGTADRFDSLQQESIGISFSEDVFILRADFNSLFGGDEFFQVTGGDFQPPNLPGRTFDQPDLTDPALASFIALDNAIESNSTNPFLDDDDIFDFTLGGAAPEGLFLPFGDILTLQAGTFGQGQFANGSVGLETLTLNVIPFDPGGGPVVPEPNSMLALMGLAGLLTTRRRR